MPSPGCPKPLDAKTGKSADINGERSFIHLRLAVNAGGFRDACPSQTISLNSVRGQVIVAPADLQLYIETTEPQIMDTRPTILLVEDDDFAAEFAMELLASGGYYNLPSNRVQRNHLRRAGIPKTARVDS